MKNYHDNFFLERDLNRGPPKWHPEMVNIRPCHLPYQTDNVCRNSKIILGQKLSISANKHSRVKKNENKIKRGKNKTEQNRTKTINNNFD